LIYYNSKAKLCWKWWKPANWP